MPHTLRMLTNLEAESRYEPLCRLRPAIFGEIRLARDRNTNNKVAIKSVDLALAFSQQSREYGAVHEDVLREVRVLEHLRALGGHPNVIGLHQCFTTMAGQWLHIVLDYCDGGDLYDVCMRASQFTTTDMGGHATPSDQTRLADLSKRVCESEALGYLVEVLNGVEFLHSNGIAHRDLSLENVLIREGHAVIADLGLCAQQAAPDRAFECTESVGKQYYMAPEVALGHAYDPRCADVWSLGIALFILLTSSPPFDSARATDAGFRFVSNRGIKPVFQAWGFGDRVSAETQDLIAQMLVVDPLDRITIGEMWCHPALVGRRSLN